MTQVVFPDAVQRFQGKKAIFRVELDGKTVSRSGFLYVRLAGGETYICVECPPLVPGPEPAPDQEEEPWRLWLSQEQVNALAPASDPEAEFDFRIETKLRFQDFERGPVG
jgi:hypothetical protein